MTAEPGARVSIFLGKGGVGKTTLAAAFALDRAAAGERVLLLSLTSAEELRARIRSEVLAGDLPDALEVATLDPRKLVDEGVRRVTMLGPMTELVTRQPGYESLVDIAPGLKEMAVLNRVWNLRREGFDRIVLDGPATGHGLHFLEAPAKTAAILVGRLKERALAVQDMLRDPAACEVVIVTLPEEMPVRETMELAGALSREGFPLDNVVVNKWLPRVFADEAPRRILRKLEGLAAVKAGLGKVEGGLDVEEWLRASSLIEAQRGEALGHLATLESLPVKLALVPYFPDPRGRLEAVARAMRTPRAKEAVA